MLLESGTLIALVAFGLFVIWLGYGMSRYRYTALGTLAIMGGIAQIAFAVIWLGLVRENATFRDSLTELRRENSRLDRLVSEKDEILVGLTEEKERILRMSGSESAAALARVREIDAASRSGPSQEDVDSTSTDLPSIIRRFELIRNEIARVKTRLGDLDTEKAGIIRERDELRTTQRVRLEGIFSNLLNVDPVRRVTLDETASTPSAEPENSRKRFDLIEGEIAHLNRFCHKPLDLQELTGLRDRMGAGIETANYKVSLHPDNEAVKGSVGKYYVVDIKDAVKGASVRFDGGRYTLDRSNPEFRNSLNKFLADIPGKVHGKVSYEIYLRGNADPAPHIGTFEKGHEYRVIEVLSSADGQRYSTATREHKVDTVVQNADLPNLRAAFLKDVIETVYPVRVPKILDGAVSQAGTPANRNTELLLYLGW